MQKYTSVSALSGDKFRRLTGVRRKVFDLMMEVLRSSHKEKRSRGGPKTEKLCLEDQLLMCLEYLREYRTYFHVSQSYRLSESQCYKICRWIENSLIKDQRFHLPGKKALLSPNVEFEVVMIDETETPVERPKKNSG